VERSAVQRSSRGNVFRQSSTAFVIARPQVVNEEEQLVALDGAAEGSSKMRLRIGVDGNNRIRVIVAPGIGNSILSQGTTLRVAEKHCFVSGHNFSRAVTV
jgi:hypothetical protein